MSKLEYIPKGEIAEAALEILDSLRLNELPIWQVKEILREAIKLADWQTMK